jgi:carbon-monoxide dehydrogenase small subunit
LAVSLDGHEVQTIEGFEADPLMSIVRKAFHEEHALQCGFCTPGMLVTARDIVSRFAEADERQIRRELSGNLCRCTGYVGIVNAIEKVFRDVPAANRVANAPPRLPTAPAGPWVSFDALPETVVVGANESGPAVFARDPTVPGSSQISESFIVEQSPEQVWILFADVPRVAGCMPGARLASFDGKNLVGEMRVSFGPIKASFSGEATIERDNAHLRGVISGGGNDARSNSRAKGQVTYGIVSLDDGKRTRVEIGIEYQLQGVLAQVARANLVREFVNRLVATFAENLSAELVGGPRSNQQVELKIGTIIWSMFVSQMKKIFGR